MSVLIVTCFYDIGRGGFSVLKRSGEQYLESFKAYVGKLEPEKYILCEADTAARMKGLVDQVDILPFGETKAARYLPRTREVIESPAFRQLFRAKDNTRHLEHVIPEYNIAVMTKMDALERAAISTSYSYSHYVWMDFGLGRRATADPWLPEPEGFHAILRDKIVISAKRRQRMRQLDRAKIERNICCFTENAAGSIMIVPAAKVQLYVDLMRVQFQTLLDWNLTTDDQTPIDMCTITHPHLFHVVPAPRRLGKFRHIHEIVCGRAG